MNDIFMRNNPREHLPEWRRSGPPPNIKGKTADPEPEHSYTIDHEVHGHGVGDILFCVKPVSTRANPALHEHDQKAGDQGPHNIDGNFVMAIGGADRLHRYCQFI